MIIFKKSLLGNIFIHWYTLTNIEKDIWIVLFTTIKFVWKYINNNCGQNIHNSHNCNQYWVKKIFEFFEMSKIIVFYCFGYISWSLRKGLQHYNISVIGSLGWSVIVHIHNLSLIKETLHVKLEADHNKLVYIEINSIFPVAVNVLNLKTFLKRGLL